ncbi:hypothetical protein [Streptomyces sp. LN245]|uniref:hypothetical protein n=1 Tax=Streptomyces sp. LN245 TaxID=3112975 RepID=UPI0037216298
MELVAALEDELGMEIDLDAVFADARPRSLAVRWLATAGTTAALGRRIGQQPRLPHGPRPRPRRTVRPAPHGPRTPFPSRSRHRPRFLSPPRDPARLPPRTPRPSRLPAFRPVRRPRHGRAAAAPRTPPPAPRTSTRSWPTSPWPTACPGPALPSPCRLAGSCLPAPPASSAAICSSICSGTVTRTSTASCARPTRKRPPLVSARR